MDERFALTAAEENQKGLKAETDTLHVCVWIVLLSSNSFEGFKNESSGYSVCGISSG